MFQNNKNQRLCAGQQAIFIDQQLNPGLPLYNIGFQLRLTGDVDRDALESAVDYICQKHPLLQCVLVENDNGVFQSVKPQFKSVLRYFDCSTEADAEAACIALLKQLNDVAIDYFAEAWRAAVVKIKADCYCLQLSVHHVFADGSSVSMMLADLVEGYNQALAGNKVNPPPDNGYLAFIKRETGYVESAKFERDKSFWCNEFDITPEPLITRRYLNHTDRISASSRRKIARQQYLIIETRLTDSGYSMMHFMVALMAAYFARVNRVDEVVIGVPLHNRSKAGYKTCVGLFAAVVPLKIAVDVKRPFADLLQTVAHKLRQCYRHLQYPLSEINKPHRLSQSGRAQLFDVSLSYEKYPVDVVFGQADCRLSYLPLAVENTPMSIDIKDYHRQEDVCFDLNCDPQFFNADDADAAQYRLKQMMAQLVRGFDEPVFRLAMLDKSDKNQLLHQFAQTKFKYQGNTPIHRYFEQQAAALGDKTALIFAGQRLSYRRFNEKANCLARAISANHEVNNALVALYFHPGLEMAIAILAVLKAGGAYVPIAPDCPDQRTRFILQDTQASLLLTQQSLLPSLDTCISPLSMAPTLMVVDAEQSLTGFRNDNLDVSCTDESLAYVIYTSGTTGQPKGVLQTHQNVVRLFAACEQIYGFNGDDVWSLYHAYSFDFSVWEFWGALLHGGQLVIPSKDCTRDFAAFADLCQQHQVTVLNQTPGAFYAFAAAVLATEKPLSRLRYVIFGGEKLNISQLQPWWNRFGCNQPRLFNMYGITETTVHTTFHELSPHDCEDISPIGRVLADMRAYVLDEHRQLVPIGVIGELYVGGAGIAKGYLNRPALTAERFIDNPFVVGEKQRLYKSGDLVSWRPEGTLVYHGRNDGQVKIRGFRIELGEIERQLLALTQIKQAAVVAQVDNDSHYLAAYVVTEADCNKPDWADIRTHLATLLPEYMIPASFNVLTEMPLTVNGKLDKKAFPQPDRVENKAHVAPRNDTETKISAIWLSVLAVEQLGVLDNFFHSGGDSIITLELVSKLRQAGFMVQTKDIFDYPTIEQLARLCDGPKTCVDIIAEQGVLQGSFELLPIQQWFFRQKLAKPAHYNQSLTFNIPATVTSEQIVEALAKLITAHDMLRTVFTGNGQTYQEDTNVVVHRLEKQTLWLALTDLQRNFDLQNGPLWQVAHITGFIDGTAKLWFAFHHLIIDAVSLRIIVDDMRLLLSGLALPPKTSSYRQWVSHVAGCEDQANYWHNVLADKVNLPVAKQMSHSRFALNTTLTENLLRHRPPGWQINDLLLSALAVALEKTFARSVNHLTLEGHGRQSDNLAIDLSRTVGWFTVLYPVRLESFASLDETIGYTRAMLTNIPNNGVGCRLANDQSLPNIRFNYLGQFGDSSDDGHWQISARDAGQSVASENISDLLLDINSAVGDGQLKVEIHARQTPEESERFAGLFEQALTQVINTQSLTPPDFVAGYDLPGNRGWYFQATTDLQQWGPCFCFEFADELDYSAHIKNAIEAVCDFHHSLRINFVEGETGRQELIKDKNDHCYLWFDGTGNDAGGLDLTSQFEQLKCSIDFTRSLVKVGYFDMGPGRKDKVYLALHHLSIDKYSLPIFYRDFLLAFDQSRANASRDIVLQRNGVTYTQWVEAQKHWLYCSQAEQNIAFWQQRQALVAQAIPTDYEFSHGINTIGERRVHVQALDQKTTDRLLTAAKNHNIDVFYLVITGFAKALSWWLNSQQVCYEAILFGREGVQDLSDTVGFLTDAVPMLVSVDSDKQGIELVESVKASIELCKSHATGFGILKAKGSSVLPQYDISQMVSPGVVVNYLPPSLTQDKRLLEHPLLKWIGSDEMVGVNREAIHKTGCTIAFNQGCLTFDWVYGLRIYKLETIKRLAESCMDELSRLVQAL